MAKKEEEERPTAGPKRPTDGQTSNSLSSNLVAHIVHGYAHAYSLVRSLHSGPSRYSPEIQYREA